MRVRRAPHADVYVLCAHNAPGARGLWSQGLREHDVERIATVWADAPWYHRKDAPTMGTNGKVGLLAEWVSSPRLFASHG